MTAHLAEARSVTVRFGQVTAVDEVHLAVDPGEVVGLLGANGAGKTTLLLTLLGLVRATSGAARLFGEAPSPRARRRVGYVPQSLGLYTDLTVGENWAFAGRAFGLAPRLPEAIAPVAGDLVADLPLGAQRRVAFALAFSHQPELLVLDEPTSGVAPLSAARLWEDIRTAAGSGAGVLVTTHNLEEAEQCDRLVVMVDGRVVATGGIADVIGSRRVARVRCDDWRSAFHALDNHGFVVQARGRELRVPGALAEVVAVLGDASISAEVDMVPANLEETFVAIVTGGQAT